MAETVPYSLLILWEILAFSVYVDVGLPWKVLICVGCENAAIFIEKNNFLLLLNYQYF